MRDRNHFCTGEGIEGFCTVLSGHFPAGRLAVLFDDPALCKRLSAALLKRYKVEVYPFDAAPKKKEDVRFVIGVGSPKTIKAVRLFAADVPFAFFAATPDYLYLNAFDGSGKLAEFAYLDRTERDNTVMETYSSLFCLWCEGRIRLFEKSYLPYRDKALSGVLASAGRVLMGECDREEFFSEGLRLVSISTNALARYGTLYVERTAILGNRPEEKFLTAWFFLFLLLDFTNVPFGAILNPFGERKQTVVYDGASLPDREKLKVFARKMRAMTSLPETDAALLMTRLAALEEKDLPLLTALREKGLFEGWKNEKFIGDRGVFV